MHSVFGVTCFPTVNAKRASLWTLLAIGISLMILGCRHAANNADNGARPKVAPADSSATSHGWYYAESKDPVKGTTMRVAKLNDQWKSDHTQTSAVLTLLRSGQTYDLSLKVPGVVMNDPPVITFRFDDGVPRHEIWLRSDDGDAAFSPAPLAFLKQLSNSQKLSVEYVPANGLPDTVSFHLSGFSTVGFLTTADASAVKTHAAVKGASVRKRSHRRHRAHIRAATAQASSVQSPE